MQYTVNYSLNKPQRGVDRANVDKLNENSDTIDELIHQNRTMIAKAYDSSQTEPYAIGDVREFEGRVYRCIAPTSGVWNPLCWEEKPLGDMIEEGGASALADLDDVSLTTPTEGQIFTYDGDEWVNADAPDVDVTKTASGNPIEVSDSASAPLVKCVAEIQGSQDLHGYDKPWVGGAGKNLGVTIQSAVANGVTFKSNADGSLTVSGTSTAYAFVDSVFTLSAGSYYLSNGVSSPDSVILMVRKTDGDVYIISATETGALFTLDTDTSIKMRVAVASGVTVNKTIYPMIRLSTETDSTFAPYSNICPITAYTEGEIEVSDGDGNTTTHTTTYPSAIYRGSEDVVNGTETHDMIAVDLGSLTWTYRSDVGVGIFSSASITDYKKTNDAEAICSFYKYAGLITGAGAFAQKGENGIFCFYSNDLYPTSYALYVCDERFANVNDFVTAVTGQTLAYELATPTTSFVTPTNLPVKSLNGYSHIESSTGEMEIEYIAKAFSPITELVDSQISALQKMMELIITANREEEMKATQNYTAGDLLIVSGKLYKASSNIANGSTLVINSNVTLTTIAAELAALA